jgi:hypothetical protein
VALVAALLAIALYASFSHGAIASPDEARLQVALAAVAAAAGGAWLWTGALRLAAPRLALAGALLLAAFAAWSGVSVLWSVAPDNTWLELNRALSYVLVLTLGIMAGASAERAARLTAEGYLLVALAVTIYGLGQKLVPGLHVGGLFDLNQTGALPRLQQPLGYWNALALVIALGAPVALAVAVDRGRARGVRVAAAVSLQLMLLAIGFTYSRGGLLALAVAMAISIGFSGARLRSLLWLTFALLAALPPLLYGLLSHSLTATNVGLGSRQTAGAVLSATLVLSAGVLIVVARLAIPRESSTYVSPQRTRTIVRLLLTSVGAVLVAAVLAVALSSRGIDGTVSHAWTSFTTTRGTSVYDPHRLLSADSANRWVWWKEAAGAFSDRPILGWGAGSFPVTHLLYRRDTLSVRQPHSVPLQWLAETGLVGALLALLAFGLLIAAVTVAVRRVSDPRRRLLMAAMLGGGIAWAVHAGYDWDWDIPAVTLPAMLLMGVLAGAAAPRRGPAPWTTTAGAPARLGALALLTLGLCVYALSATLPSLAASDAGDALVTAAGSSPSATQDAAHEAALASRLDPLSDAGPRAQASLALRTGQMGRAQGYLLEAVRREPDDAGAWTSLAYVSLRLGDKTLGQHAAERALALDPRGQATRGLIADVFSTEDLLSTPPQDSATGRPLP